MTILKKINESEGYIETDDYGIVMSCWEQFSFVVPNYKFTPAGKTGKWDGRVRLINLATRKFPLGLAIHIQKFINGINEECELSDEVKNSFLSNESENDIIEFIKTIKCYSHNKEIFPRDDQLNAIVRSIKYNRCTNICPTSFGKSLAIFIQTLWHIKNNRKVIIIVPTVELVRQFENDIIDYCTNEQNQLMKWTPKIHTIFAGKDKILPKNFYLAISTWQSIYKLDEDFINQFDVIILDESHKINGKSLQNVFNKASTIKYRTGWTGSLEDKSLNRLSVEGYIGPIKEITDTKTLMDKGIVASIDVKILQFKYDEEISKKVAKLDYNNEIKFIEKHTKRTQYIANVISKLDKTGLLLFRHIEHGDKLVDIISKTCPNKNIYYIHGNFFRLNGVKYKTLEELKPLIEKDKNGIVVSNYQIFSTGLSIKNLHFVIFGAPVKAFVTTVQSIGRGLRISETKNHLFLIDIVDDFSFVKRTKRHYNYSFNHFIERYNIYTSPSRSFNYSIKKISL